ncbi:MAG: DinB family protein [Anaerolineales bacterium]
MSSAQKTHLLDLLAESHSSTQEVLKKVGLDLQVYMDLVWRVRDILWHIAVWDRQTTNSILAFENGGQYAIQDFDEGVFNEAAFKEGREFTQDQVLEESNQARLEFQHAVQKFPLDQLDSQLLFPWGDEQGDVAKLVKYMIEHDNEHRAEIIAAGKF